MAKKKVPATADDYRRALVELCEALEGCQIVNEVEAGCDNDGAYIRACKVLGRKPKFDPRDDALDYPDEPLAR